MKKLTILEIDNFFTIIGLFTVIVEVISSLEKQIRSLENILEMNYAIDQDLHALPIKNVKRTGRETQRN
jgi:hypothetical protein